MNESKVTPIFGTYLGPDGSKALLCSPMDVYDLFRALIKRMPKTPLYSDRRRPELGVFRIERGRLVNVPR